MIATHASKVHASPWLEVARHQCLSEKAGQRRLRLHYFGARSFSVLIQARFLSISINITCIALQIHAHRSNAHRAASKPAKRWRKAPLKAPRRLSVRPHGRAIAPPPDERGGVGTSGSARVRMTRTTRSTSMHLSHEKAA